MYISALLSESILFVAQQRAGEGRCAPEDLNQQHGEGERQLHSCGDDVLVCIRLLFGFAGAAAAFQGEKERHGVRQRCRTGEEPPSNRHVVLVADPRDDLRTGGGARTQSGVCHSLFITCHAAVWSWYEQHRRMTRGAQNIVQHVCPSMTYTARTREINPSYVSLLPQGTTAGAMSAHSWSIRHAQTTDFGRHLHAS